MNRLGGNTTARLSFIPRKIQTAMPRLILFGDSDSIAVLNETGYPETIIRNIRNGLWKPKLPDTTGPFQAFYNGETIIVTRHPSEPKKMADIHLTPHELCVLRGLVDGLGDQQIALVNQMKLRMVRHYVTKLKVKLRASSREQLVAYAVALGLVEVVLE